LPASRHLKGKEVRSLIREFTQHYPAASSTLEEASNFEELIVEDGAIIFVDGKPLILKVRGFFLPSLRFDELISTLSKVVVDMGAVAHVANGAQIMRPGVTQIKNSFSKGDLVVIQDEKFGKAIAIGVAEMTSSEMQAVSKGKVISNIHYVGDTFWKEFGGTKSS